MDAEPRNKFIKRNAGFGKDSSAGNFETMDSSFGKVPPHDLGAEAAVLSAILLAPDVFDSVFGLVKSDSFYADANRRIYGAMTELHSKGRAIDIISVASFLKDRGTLEQIGGAPYLAQLSDATPSVANVEEHAKVVAEKARVRKVISVCQSYAAQGYGDYGTAQEFVDGAEQAIFDLAQQDEKNAVMPIRDALEAAFRVLEEASQNGEGITGIPTGFHELDKTTSGIHSGELYIIAGRPGMGKTSFVMNLACNSASPTVSGKGEAEVEQAGYGVAFFSLEMPREQLAARLLSSEARVDVSKIRSGLIGADDWNRLTETASYLGKLPLWIDDTPAISLLDLRAKIRRLHADIARGSDKLQCKKLGLVVIDYLQLMQGRRDAGSREQEISEISRGLKQLAKEMDVGVIALSQLNRSVETRSTRDKRPQLSDLRESGAIEQDADAIIFIYRDEYYFPNETTEPGVAEIILAKQRNGPTGTVKVSFTGNFTRFDNLAQNTYDLDQFDDFDGA